MRVSEDLQLHDDDEIVNSSMTRRHHKEEWRKHITLSPPRLQRTVSCAPVSELWLAYSGLGFITISASLPFSSPPKAPIPRQPA